MNRSWVRLQLLLLDKQTTDLSLLLCCLTVAGLGASGSSELRPVSRFPTDTDRYQLCYLLFMKKKTWLPEVGRNTLSHCCCAVLFTPTQLYCQFKKLNFYFVTSWDSLVYMHRDLKTITLILWMPQTGQKLHK